MAHGPEETPTVGERGGVATLFLVFLRLGLTSFGGPVAHIGYFRDEFVTRRKWLTDRAYADLVALCQFLPGPASSQVGMGIGLSRGGMTGALAAWLGFTLPSALLMIAAGYGILAAGTDGTPGWLEGLKIVAVAVVAQAVWGMARSHAADLPRMAIAFAGAAIALLWQDAIAQIAIIALGGLAGAFLPAKPAPDDATHFDAGIGRAVAVTSLLLFAGLLVALPLLAAATDAPTIDIADASYRSGALVFGGGHVVLPLLEESMVGPGWLTEDEFLAGYGLAQAVPGPLFSFSAYLGTAMDHGPGGALGGVLALVAIFLPSFLLVVGILPFWDGLRRRADVRRVLTGVNASVVGLLLAALWDPVITSAINDVPDALLALAALAALMWLKLPPWVVVAATAAGGAIIAAL